MVHLVHVVLSGILVHLIYVMLWHAMWDMVLEGVCEGIDKGGYILRVHITNYTLTLPQV